MGDNDELVAGIDSTSSLSSAELERREQLFHKRVKKQTAIMMSPTKFKDNQRAAAARLLGEYGEPTSIPYLVKAYKNDKSSAVRKAAGESLGMLKTLGDVFSSEDEEMRGMAMELVQNIVINNQLGRPSRMSVGGVRAFSFLLMLIALGVIAASFVISFQPEDPSLVSLEVQLTRTAAVVTPPTPLPSPTSNDPQVLLDQFKTIYAVLDNESRVLQAQMLTITRQQPQDCSIVFTETDQYTVPDVLTSLPQFTDAANGYNAAEEIIARVRGTFQQSCRSQQAIPRQEALTLSQQLVEAQRGLSAVAPILTSYGVALPPTVTAIAVPTNTAEPTDIPLPTATVDTSAARLQIRAMTTTISDMIGVRGKASLLLSYWQNVVAGSSNDCLQMPPPLIPAEIVVVADALNIAPDLQEIANSTNGALTIVRNSYQAFDSGCNTNQLRQLVDTQIPAVQAAITALTDAQNRLETLQAALP